MNTSFINSTLQFNQTTSGSSLPLGNVNEGCKHSFGELSFDFIVSVFNMLVGYPANVIVMWLVSRKKSDFSTSDIFIFNLALADACYCMMSPISCVGYYIFEIRDFFKFNAFAYGIKDTTPLFLTCICLDRYVAVVHPIVFTSIRDNKIRVAISMLIWGFALPFAVSRSLKLVGAINIFSGFVLTTFAIMIFCNISITWSLRKSVFGKEKMHPKKKKALRTVLIALAIIVFHYLPIVAILPLTLYYYFPEYCHIELAAFVLMDISSSTEPLIYIAKMEQLPWLNILPWICCQSPSTEPNNGSA